MKKGSVAHTAIFVSSGGTKITKAKDILEGRKPIGIDKVIAVCNSAKETPRKENAFRQLRLNQWVKQAVRWRSGTNARFLLMKMTLQDVSAETLCRCRRTSKTWDLRWYSLVRGIEICRCRPRNL